MENNDRSFKAFTESMAALANISKVAANVTDPEKKKEKPANENLNQQHQQSVNVLVGEQEKKPSVPIIVKEKPETHIHKRFPDNRALTKDECDLEVTRLKLEFEEAERERAYRKEMEEKYMKERKEREEKYMKERKEREEKYMKEREEKEHAERLRKEQERKQARKRRQAVAGGIGIGLIGLAVYSWMRYDRNGNLSDRKLPEPKAELNLTISGEGSVE